MQLTDWLLVEVALLLFGLTKISLIKSAFNHLSVIESPLRLRDQEANTGRMLALSSLVYCSRYEYTEAEYMNVQLR
jgi:hypothetical protein